LRIIQFDRKRSAAFACRRVLPKVKATQASGEAIIAEDIFEKAMGEGTFWADRGQQRTRQRKSGKLDQMATFYSFH
jgi:hypothetical protein